MGVRFLRIAVVYLVAGACLGLAMGLKENFVLAPVHAHLLLLGWASLALAGIIYHLHPGAATTRLASVHFWLHNLGLPVFMLGLGLLLTGNDVPVLLPAGAFAVLLGFVCFAINAWRCIRA